MEFLKTAIVAVVVVVCVVPSCPSASFCAVGQLDILKFICSSHRLNSIPTDLPNYAYIL